MTTSTTAPNSAGSMGSPSYRGPGRRRAAHALRARSRTASIDRRSAAFEPDRVLRLRAADGYDVHRLIYESFATEHGRDFLYAPFVLEGNRHAVFVRRFDVATRFAEEMEFRMTLRAMPTVKANGRRRSIGAARSKDPMRLRWLEARATERGFALLAAPEMRVERVRLEAARRPFAFNACIYRVVVRVTDAVRFTRAYTRGVGQGRAWGCAMAILREV